MQRKIDLNLKAFVEIWFRFNIEKVIDKKGQSEIRGAVDEYYNLSTNNSYAQKVIYHFLRVIKLNPEIINFQ